MTTDRNISCSLGQKTQDASWTRQATSRVQGLENLEAALDHYRERELELLAELGSAPARNKYLLRHLREG